MTTVSTIYKVPPLNVLTTRALISNSRTRHLKNLYKVIKKNGRPVLKEDKTWSSLDIFAQGVIALSRTELTEKEQKKIQRIFTHLSRKGMLNNTEIKNALRTVKKQMSVPLRLDTLPEEVLLLILFLLSPHEIVTISKVNKLFCFLGNDRAFWQQKASDEVSLPQETSKKHSLATQMERRINTRAEKIRTHHPIFVNLLLTILGMQKSYLENTLPSQKYIESQRLNLIPATTQSMTTRGLIFLETLSSDPLIEKLFKEYSQENKLFLLALCLGDAAILKAAVIRRGAAVPVNNTDIIDPIIMLCLITFNDVELVQTVRSLTRGTLHVPTQELINMVPHASGFREGMGEELFKDLTDFKLHSERLLPFLNRSNIKNLDPLLDKLKIKNIADRFLTELCKTTIIIKDPKYLLWALEQESFPKHLFFHALCTLVELGNIKATKSLYLKHSKIFDERLEKNKQKIDKISCQCQLFNAAVRSRSLKILKWAAISRGARPDMTSYNQALATGHEKMVYFLKDVYSCKPDQESFTYAVLGGNCKLAKMHYTQDVSFDASNYSHIVAKEDLKMLRLLKEWGFPIFPKLLLDAFATGKLEIIQGVVELGVPIPYDLFSWVNRSLPLEISQDFTKSQQIYTYLSTLKPTLNYIEGSGSKYIPVAKDIAESLRNAIRKEQEEAGSDDSQKTISCPGSPETRDLSD